MTLVDLNLSKKLQNFEHLKWFLDTKVANILFHMELRKKYHQDQQFHHNELLKIRNEISETTQIKWNDSYYMSHII